MSQKLTVQLAKITGTPSRRCWSQTHTFFPEEAKKQKKRGLLLSCLSFSGKKEGIEALVTGREILSRLHEEFYGELETDPYPKLSLVVSKVCQEFSDENQELEIIAACVLEDVLYLALIGGGQAWVKRRGFFQKVLSGGQTLEQASGFLRAGDLLLLGTASFFQSLSSKALRTLLEMDEPKEMVEVLAPLVGGQEDSSRMAAIIGLVEEEEERKEVSLPKEPRPVLRDRDRERGELFKSLLKKPAFFLTQLFSKLEKRLQPQKPSPDQEKKKRVVFTVAIILILLLFSSIFLGIGQRKKAEKQEDYKVTYQEALRLLEEGEALINFNPSFSKEQLLLAQEKLEHLESLGVEKEKTRELTKRVKEALLMVVKEKKIEEAEVFFDLGLLVAEAKGERLSLAGNSLVVLDKEKNRVLLVDIKKKSGKILAGGEDLKDASFLSSYADFAFVFTPRGIFRIGFEGTKGKLLIEKDEKWGKVIDLSSYAGNLYLLDQKGVIWRYQRNEEGFYGQGSNWFGEGVAPDFSQAVCLAIDGSIWVLTKEGKILKFTRGALDAFAYKNLPEDLVSPTVLYTDGESENLYLLEAEKERIVVLAKSGEYQFQYLWSGLREARDLVVSEKEGKIFILRQEKIYEISRE